MLLEKNTWKVEGAIPMYPVITGPLVTKQQHKPTTCLRRDLRICQRHPSCINILGAKKEDHCYDQNLGSRKINHVKHVMLMDRHQVSRPNLSTELVKRKPVFTNKN